MDNPKELAASHQEANSGVMTCGGFDAVWLVRQYKSGNRIVDATSPHVYRHQRTRNSRQVMTYQGTNDYGGWIYNQDNGPYYATANKNHYFRMRTRAFIVAKMDGQV